MIVAYKAERDREHVSQNILGTVAAGVSLSSTATTLPEDRRWAMKELREAKTKLQALVKSGGHPQEISAAEQMVCDWEERVRRMTLQLGVTDSAADTHFRQCRARGIAARVALKLSGTQDVPKCVFCTIEAHILCYLCHAHLCTGHALYIGGGGINKAGMRRGGAAASCVDNAPCRKRQAENGKQMTIWNDT